MKILGISGSASLQSSNFYLLKAIQGELKDKHSMKIIENLSEFPLFTPQRLENGIPKCVLNFKKELIHNDVIIMSTPEYTHNIPAVLKNMIEWCTHSGEFESKKIIAMTFTPYEPRGKFAMQSLLSSLKAMKANIIAQFPLYRTDVTFLNREISFTEESKTLIKEAVKLLE